MYLRIIIFLNIINHILLQDKCNDLLKTNKCFSNYCNDDPNTKECLINNILIIENTNGEIYMNQDAESNIIAFGTTLSSNEDRVYYSMIYNDDISSFFDNNNDLLFLKIKIPEGKEIKNAEIFFWNTNILLFGSDNSYLEILGRNKQSIFIEATHLLGGNNNIKGNPFLFKFINNKLYFVAITSTEENLMNYNISFYHHDFDNNINNYNNIHLNKSSNFETEIKGEYMSCDLVNENPILISCFYLTKDNNYTIILIDEESDKFALKKKLVVEQKEEIESENPYFMKIIAFTSDFCIYAYYSGELSDIPTFLIKSISKTDYSINDRFSDFPIVYLYDYIFNNEIKFNDIVIIKINEFYFISTGKNKETIIISYIKFYSSNEGKEQLLIRYYTVSLTQNYNMKILNGLKAIYFNSQNSRMIPFLTLGFDFCFNEYYSNSNNAGLIMFSFSKFLADDQLDFIEYAFNNNRDHIILNLTQITGIQNNIFGYDIDYYELFSYEEIEIFDINGEEIDYQIYPNNALVKIILNEYIFEMPSFMIFLSIFCSLPKKVEQFNKLFNKINDTFGDKTDESSYTLNQKSLYSHTLYYYIYIEQELSNKCNNNLCDLCLKTDLNYCLVCKDDNYYFIEDQNHLYNKSKICLEKKTDKITEEITNEITEKKTIEITDKIMNKITEKITDEITNEITVKITNEITSEITGKKTEEITNEITNKITNKITEEITNEIKEIVTNFITEKITNKDTEEIINVITNKLTNEMTERLSNEAMTEKLIDEVTEKIKEEKTELITNEYIREITDKITEKLSNKDNINYITSNIETEKLINELTNKINTNGISNITEISFEELMKDKYKNASLSNEEIEEIYKHIKDYITKNYDGNNTIINTSNVKIQISKIDDQKDSELSNIDLGVCEEILKSKYCKTENDSLIMLKFDIKPENETSTFVHYEVYSTRKQLYLELEECSGNNVIVNVPIELSSEMEEIYEFLSQSGYNIFDSNDSFYNDICAAFTTQNGTDILLYDRRMDIYKTTLNISLCQEGCDFQSYDIKTKKAKCNCYSQKKDLNIEDLSEIKFDKNQMVNDFYQTIQNSNFRVLKCYKLVFNIKIFIKNIGSIGMSVLLAIFNILIIIHLTLGSTKIHSFIQIIIKNKYLENGNNNSNKSDKEMKSKNSDRKEVNKKNEVQNKIENKKKRKNRISVAFNKKLSLEKLRDIKRKKTSINLSNKGAPPKRKNSQYKRINNEGSKLDKKYLSNKKKNNKYGYSLITSKMMTLNLNEKNSNDSEIISKSKKKSKNKKYSKKLGNDLKIYQKHKNSKENQKHHLNHKRSTAKDIPFGLKSKKSTKDMKSIVNISKNEETSNNLKSKILEKDDFKNNEKITDLNTQELNSLKYEEALRLDKRTYFQYYFSLLKKKHLILFTFLPTNDYNLMSLKIALFIVSFSMYFTIETFFFNDETMHKIYQESGVYNIITQIPQILYSSIVSSIINMILKSLSLSEKDILKIKKETNMHSTVKMSKSIEKCIKIKSFLFFTLSLLLMLFFWYFISCFCAVYYNTQIILIKNTLISFSLSMLYPIGINLIPGMFRIPALRAKKKNKKCLYSFSQYVALI